MHDIRFHRHPDPDAAPRTAHQSGKLVVAVCGKGGVGKTALSALLVDELASHPEAGHVLAIDADPALGLAVALGIDVEKTIGEVRERVIRTADEADAGQMRELADNLDFLVASSIVETERYAFVAMGRSEALGCYCSVNDLLKAAIAQLVERFDTVVIDGEAGLEQINRQVLGTVDRLLLVADGSARSMRTVSLLRDIAVRDGIASEQDVSLVFVRPTADVDDLVHIANEARLPVDALVPADPEVARHDALGIPLTELPADAPARREVAHLSCHLLGVGHGHGHGEHHEH